MTLSTAIAEAKRDDGMARAIEHAESDQPGWAGIALDFLRGYARMHVDFLAEDVVAAAAMLVPDPPDGRAWGYVFRRAAREGVIQKAGYAPAKTSNLSPKVMWASRVLDLGANFERDEWLKLARNYLRMYRQAVKREGFYAFEVQEYAFSFGCPKPRMVSWWYDALQAEGMQSRTDGLAGALLWFIPEACCDECTEHRREHG